MPDKSLGTEMDAIDLVTGTGGYSGSFIARRLLNEGRSVRTLTRDPKSVGSPIDAFPYRFDQPAAMAEAFDGVDTFYNTFWVRFGHGGINHDDAVANSRALIDAAAKAGVRRIVHTSIMKPSLDSQYSYHRGKALVEEAVKESGLSYAILRPSVFFGGGDVLVNNVAYLVRRLPVFAIPGDGKYQVRPTHVEDFADRCVELGKTRENECINAGGPDTFTFKEFVSTIRDGVGAHCALVCAPAVLVKPFIFGLNKVTRDIVVHREELTSLMEGLASCDGPPVGNRRLTDYVSNNRATVGRKYASEIQRNF